MERSNSRIAGSKRSRVALRVVAGFLGLLCWVGSTGDALAAGTFVVDGAHPSCSDTGPGTEATPYCTISTAAAARGGPGTTILVKPGIYREQVNVPVSGADGSPFVFQALGPGVVVDGTDDFSDPALWTPFAGDVWLAAGVTWEPKQAFADGVPLIPSTAEPADLAPRTFRHVRGEGLYVNLGGDNPGTHQTLVGRRLHGFRLYQGDWVTFDGFTVTRTEERAIVAWGKSNNITNNTVTFAGRQGIWAALQYGLIGANVVSDNREHGIELGSFYSTIQDNESFRNGGHGIRLDGSLNSLLQRNRAHHNQGSGIHFQHRSGNTISVQNLSWNNGRDGFEFQEIQPSSVFPRNFHVGDVASGNSRRGFSLVGLATNISIFNSVGVNNGVTTGEFDLFVDSTSAPHLVSNSNIFWNGSSQAPITYSDTTYATIAAFTAATGHDATSLQADPRFVNPEAGDFRLLPGSPAIDASDASVLYWPATDAVGQARVDDPATPDTGAGPVPYGDRGALEFLPVGPPLAALTVTPASGTAPLVVTLDASASTDADGTIVVYLFDFGDGMLVGPQAEATATHTYAAGTFTARVTVTDEGGATDSATTTVTVTPPNQAPVAALTLAPSSGTAPLEVRFDASGSTDPEGRIVSYLFDFGDGTVVGPQVNPTGTHVYGPGNRTATATVTDELGATGSATARVQVAETTSENLAWNPSFEFGTQGWSAYNCATLYQVAGGIEGAFALEVRDPATPAPTMEGCPSEFGINDSPNFVARTPAAGTRYRFTAWVRLERGFGEARLHVREYLNGVHLGTTNSISLPLLAAWQLLAVDHVAQAAGSTLDFQVHYAPRTRGEAFQVDSASIQIIAGALAGGTFFVDRAHPGCSDTAPGAGTETTPYCTISTAAAARGGPGATLLVKPAVYREEVGVQASGAEGSPFVLRALGAPVEVDGTPDDFSSPTLWTPATGTVWLAAGVTSWPSRVTVDGIDLNGSSPDPPAILRLRSYTFIPGEGLYVNLGGDNPGTHQTLVAHAYGFHLPQRTWVTIEGFTMRRAIIHMASSSNITVARNTLMTGSTIWATTSSNITVAHNTLTGSNISAKDSSNVTVAHNTLTGAGISAEDSSRMLIASNVISDGDGIYLRAVGATIQDNELFRNRGHGIELYRSGGLLQRNNVHDNGGSGIDFRNAGGTSLQNRSWNNGGHGFNHHLSSPSGVNPPPSSPHIVHIGDVVWGNGGRGFSVEGSYAAHIFNSIAVNNGLTTGEYDLFVDSSSAPGFVSNANIFWNSTSQPPIKFSDTKYATLAAFTAATGHDATSLQVDPRFVDPAGGDFRLLPGSPAIDAADSSLSHWPATDAAGHVRVDDPATANTGAGPVPYADRGALEFLPFGPPLAALTVTPPSGGPPLTVTADASRSADPDGLPLSFLFDFGDGTVVGPQPGPTASHTYEQVGIFTVTVTVTDNEGGTASPTATVTVTQPPVAALTVTPAWGIRPLTVTADASASSDPDGAIVSYRFDFGDGAAVGPQVSPTATRTYSTGNRIHVVTVTVTDDRGATGTASATVMVAGGNGDLNLVRNPSFESDTGGWSAYGGASLQRIPGGFEGAFALEVRGPASTTEFGINDSPNWVASTLAAGMRYRFTAWVRSTASTGKALMKVREYLDGAQVGGTTRSPSVALTPAWQLLLVDHVTQAAGSTLDLQVAAMPLAPGAVFEVDHLAIRVVTSTTNQPPNGVIDTPAGDVTIGVGQSVPFTSTGSDPDSNLPLTYAWHSPYDVTGDIKGQDPGPVVFRRTGTYAVTLTVFDSLGLADPTPDRRVITVHAPPEGVIDSPAGEVTIAAGESVVFAGTGTDPGGHLPLTFQWDFAGGAPNTTVENPGAVTFSTAGSYTVTFTAINSLGLADPTPASRLIRVLASQAPDGVIETPATDVTISAGQSVSFTGTGTDPDGNLPLSFLWHLGGAAPNATVEDPGAVVFERPGVYWVGFTVTDSSGVSDPTPDSRLITVVCSPNLACNSSFEGPTTGWGPYGGATLERVSGGQEGAFALEVRGPASIAEFGINDSPNWVARTGAAGTRYRFSAWVRAAASTGRARLKVREYLTGVQVGGATSSPFVPLTPDWQLLTLGHVTQAAGSTLDFQVLDSPVAAGEVFQVDNIAIQIVTTSNQPPNGEIDTPATNVTITAGQSVTFAGTGTDPEGHLPLSFLWTFGGGAPNSTVEDPGAVTFSTPGTYTVTLTVTDSLGLADPTPDSRVITVIGPNQAPNGVIDTPATNVTITAGQSVTFAGTGTDPEGHLPLTFVWTFGGGAPDSTVEDPGAVTFSTPGTYTVTLTVTDSVGAADPTPDSRVIVVADPSGASNLVRNPSFESDTSGWRAYGSTATALPTLERVAGGQEGAFALEVRGPTTTALFGINDSPDWVGSTGATGTRYRFTAWVRSAAHTGQARLRIREYNGGVQIGPTVRSAPVTLSPVWQMLTVDFIAGAAGSTLDFQVLDYVPVAPGEVFQVDTIAIVIVP